MYSGAKGQARGQKSRRELIAIAMDCFARFGYQGTSVDRIAKAAGVTKGAIYYHFRDKEDLLTAAVADRVEEFEQRVQRACEDMGAAEALRRIARVCVDHAKSNDYPRFTITLMVEAIETNHAISNQLREMMRRFRAFLREIIRNGQQEGVFRSDVDASAAAAMFTSCVLGAEVQYFQDPERFRFSDSLELFLEQLIGGLEAAAGGPGENGSRETAQSNGDPNT